MIKIFYLYLVFLASNLFANESISSFSTGGYHTCISNDLKTYCVGNNAFMQREVPLQLKNLTFMSAGPYHTCGIKDENIWCWGGFNQFFNDFNKPIQVSTGHHHNCVLDLDGVHC